MKTTDQPFHVEATRGEHRETVHEVHAVLCDAQKNILGCFGNPETRTYERSVAKPIQLLTAIQHRPSLLDECSNEEIAVMASSHSGEQKHTETLYGLLNRYGLDESMLLCGTHPAFLPEVGRELARQGIDPKPIHHNCSGKHTSMLLACQSQGWPYESYNKIDHPIQVAIRRNMGRYAGLDPDGIDYGPDGCGVPSWWLDLRSIAVTSAKYGDAGFGDDLEKRIRHRIFEAYHKASWWTSGTGRIDFDFNRESDGKWLAKGGGEAVFGVSFKDRAMGLSLKVLDGRYEVVPVALMYIMKEWNLMSKDQARRLSKWVKVVRRNSPGWDIGYYRVVDLQ
jgi:L-asparaginase II